MPRNSQPDLLEGMTDEKAVKALALGTRVELPSGSQLFALGDHADKLYLIERGRIRLTLPMRVRGKEEDVLVEERSAGQTVGWSALIPPYRFTLKATAPLDTVVTALSRDSLRALFDSDPEIGCTASLNLATIVGQRLQLFQAMWLREMQRAVEMRCH